MIEKHLLFIEEGYQRSAVAIKHAASLGYRVSLLSTEDPQYCGDSIWKFIKVDTHDISAVIEAADTINQTIPLSGVVTAIERLPAVAAVCGHLKLPGISEQAAKVAQHKSVMRQTLAEHDIPQPKFVGASLSTMTQEDIDYVGLPAVIKPVGGAGGGGVFIVRTTEDVENAKATLRSISETKPTAYGYFPDEIIVEGYMAGAQFSIEGFVQDTRVHIVTATEKTITDDTVESIHMLPARLSAEERACAADVTIRAIRAMGVDNTMIHMELVKTGVGFQIIEINARISGGCIGTHLIPIAFGYDMVQAMCQVACGEKASTKSGRPSGYAAATFVRSTRPGKVLGLEGLDNASKSAGIADVVSESTIQKVMRNDERASDDRLCAVISEGCTAEEALMHGQRASAMIDTKTSAN